MSMREIILAGVLIGLLLTFGITNIIGGVSTVRDANRCMWFSEVVRTAEGPPGAQVSHVTVVGRCPSVLPPVPRPAPRDHGLWIDYRIQGPTYLDARLDICLRHGEVRVLPGAMIPPPGFKCPEGVKKP